jgi:hypothetical protein
MAEKKKTKNTPENSGPKKKEDSISTVREILFGNKIHEFEKRFEDLEKHLDHETGNIREEVDRLYKLLENLVKTEQKALQDSFKEEQEKRLNAEKRLREDIDMLSKQLTDHKEATADTLRDIRQLILDQHKNLSEDIQRFKKELHSTLETKAAGLEERKVSRLGLADLLTEVALQLGKEPAEPQSGG